MSSGAGDEGTNAGQLHHMLLADSVTLSRDILLSMGAYFVVSNEVGTLELRRGKRVQDGEGEGYKMVKKPPGLDGFVCDTVSTLMDYAKRDDIRQDAEDLLQEAPHKAMSILRDCPGVGMKVQEEEGCHYLDIIVQVMAALYTLKHELPKTHNLREGWVEEFGKVHCEYDHIFRRVISSSLAGYKDGMLLLKFLKNIAREDVFCSHSLCVALLCLTDHSYNKKWCRRLRELVFAGHSEDPWFVTLLAKHMALATERQQDLKSQFEVVLQERLSPDKVERRFLSTLKEHVFNARVDKGRFMLIWQLFSVLKIHLKEMASTEFMNEFVRLPLRRKLRVSVCQQAIDEWWTLEQKIRGRDRREASLVDTPNVCWTAHNLLNGIGHGTGSESHSSKKVKENSEEFLHILEKFRCFFEAHCIRAVFIIPPTFQVLEVLEWFRHAAKNSVEYCDTSKSLYDDDVMLLFSNHPNIKVRHIVSFDSFEDHKDKRILELELSVTRLIPKFVVVKGDL